MVWNIAPECISTVILCIIWVYSRKGNPLPTLKNHFFQACFLITFCSMVSNILATQMLFDYQNYPMILLWGINEIYFIMTPLMGLVYYCYVTSTIFESDELKIRRIILTSSWPAVIYILFVITNPWNHYLFHIHTDTGYHRGPLIFTTYLIFYVYCAACFILVLLNHKRVDGVTRRILASFPLVAFLVVLIQQYFSNVILSGSAATCALLLIYLYLQNKQISIDYLTGIPNRNELTNMIQLYIRRLTETPFLVIVLSLRGFKQINDRYGQHTGDLFLQEIAEYLKEIAKGNEIYRFSGDEFAILIKGLKEEEIRNLASAISQRMLKPWAVKDCVLRIPAVLGIVSYPLTAENVEGLVNGIEYAVATAKENSKSNYCFCTADMIKHQKRFHQIREILKEKVEQNDLVVYFQPILNCESNRLSCAESLLRIPDTAIGPLFPDEFIPIAERTGLIVEMTYQILHIVCRFLKKLDEQGKEVEWISINFSRVQFMEENLEEKIIHIIDEYELPYHKIKIEITESVLAENPERIQQFAEKMQAKGIGLGLDDFGTGYSNVVSVVNTLWDTIKLDKSLIWTAMESKRCSIMTSNLTGIFKELGLKVLAEGIENEEQKEYVICCGCDLIQGFLYARPMPEEQAEALIGTEITEHKV